MDAAIVTTPDDTAVSATPVVRPRPVEENLADRLRMARRRRALSQEALAVRASTTREVIQKIENGKSLRPRKIVSIAEALDVEPSWLMFGQRETAPSLSPEAMAVAKAWSKLPEGERKAVRDAVMHVSNRD
jgi:transcriptional regulator with XRE-family HTH domain